MDNFPLYGGNINCRHLIFTDIIVTQKYIDNEDDFNFNASPSVCGYIMSLD